MGMTLRQLELFLAVAEETHFGRAAERMHVSQPVVSQEVRRLERTLDTALFDRTTRTVHLTAAGESVLEDARAVRSAADHLMARARLLVDDRSQRLRVAVSPSVIDEILPIALRRAEKVMPHAVLEEVAVETGEVEDALLHRECDVGLGRFLEPPQRYRSKVIRTEPVLAALSKRHPLARLSEIDLAGIGDLPLLLWPREQNPQYHDHIMTICAKRGLDPLLLISPPRIVGGRSYLIADGRAFGLIPESTANRLSSDIAAVPLANPATLPMSVLWMERDPRPVVAAFLDLVRQVGAELDGREK